jgi:general stress protein 26
MKYTNRFSGLVAKILLTIILIFPLGIFAQKNKSPIEDRATLIAAAREIMTAAGNCALITLDKSGHPNVRTMDPFSPEEDLVVWFGTNNNSRKVNEIRNDPRTTLYYESPNGGGYVVIKGHASIIDDPQIKMKYWKN